MSTMADKVKSRLVPESSLGSSRPPSRTSPTTSCFGQVWERRELSLRDRSLVTVASLV